MSTSSKLEIVAGKIKFIGFAGNRFWISFIKK